MNIEHLAAFNLALLVALISPGPALLYALRTTLSSGRAAGVATGCGLATMAATWTLMALLGLDGVFRLFPWAYTVCKILGALYLIMVAWKTWRAAADPIETSAQPNARAFLGGLLINLANPKAVLFAAAVLVVIFPIGLSATQKAIIVGNHLIVEIVAYSSFALMLSTRSVSRQYLRAKPVLDRIAAAVLGTLGMRLILDR
ncbi:MAG: LysE family transporter [Hyphomicrobiales bacterium]|nr:LysE family transporter [Hyphomicrobiales bacterium]